MKYYDVMITGGGASGMAAAIGAARAGAVTALIEAQPRIGRKLLSTGNGRCNITNRYVSPEYYRADTPETLREILERFGVGEIERFFYDIGVPIFEEREGRMYPRCETASGVLDMLRFELAKLGVEIMTEKRVGKIYGKGSMWTVLTECGSMLLSAPAAILALGSPANPQLGGSSDGVDIARSLGIRVNDCKPSLCPLLSPSPLLKALKGVRVHCRVSLMKNGSTIDAQDGELQFNDGNLSGICVFQLSNRIAGNDLGGICISADYAPYMSRGELISMLHARRDTLGALAAEDFLSGLLNKRLTAAVLKTSAVSPMTKKAASLSDRDLISIADSIKSMRFDISGPAGWKQAQTASGGIPLSGLTDLLEIKGAPGLFACGESIDCTGDCGGFNLHWAWASGLTAGGAAAEYSKNHTRNRHDNK